MASIKIRTTKDGKKAYDVDIRRRGFPRVFQTFESLTKAKLWLQDTEASMRAGRFLNQQEAKKHTLSEAIDHYIEDELPKKPKSYEEQKYQLEWFKKVAGYMLLADVTPPALVEIKREFLKGTNAHGKGRSPQTWNRYQSILSCVFQKCRNEWMWMDENPARRLRREKESRGRVRFLKDEERTKLLEACKKSESRHLHCAVVLALSTGMRNAEIRNLTWEQVDISQGAILLEDTKNGERRRVPVRGYALELLKLHGKVRRIDTNLVFPGKRSKDKVVPFDINTWWNKAVTEAGIKDFRFHDLRHACASYLAMDGASLLEIAEVLGHKTLQMVKRYSHLAESHTASVVERMNNKIFGR